MARDEQFEKTWQKLGGHVGKYCYECKERYPACHDSCEKYKQAKEEHEQYKETVTTTKLTTAFCTTTRLRKSEKKM